MTIAHRMYAALATLATLVVPESALAQGLRGDPAAVALARTMIERMGGRERWARATTMHIVEEVHRPNASQPYRSEFVRSLVRPEMWFRGVAFTEGKPDQTLERAFLWTATTGWSSLGGVVRPATQQELARWTVSWPGNVYAMYGRLAREDATLSLATLGPRRFAVNNAATGARLTDFEVGEDGAILRWARPTGDVEEWIYGPLRDFGPIRMPHWGARVGDGYRFYYRSVILSDDDRPLAFRTSTAPAMVLRGATLIDGTGGAPQRDRTILVHDGRIVAIGGPDLTVPPSAQVLDLRGKFVIPGLCDAHAHFRYGEASLPRFLANGVTCLREMWGDLPEVASWRARIDSGTMFGPRILDVSAGFPDNADNPERVVDSVARMGATFIKIGDGTARETYDRLHRAAKARGIAVIGHLPNSISAIDAANMGQRSIEHANRLVFDAAAGGDTLRAALARATTRPQRFAVLAAAAAQYDSTRADQLGRALAETPVMLAPTLLSPRRLAFRNDSTFDNDPRLRHVPDSTRARWRRFDAANQLDAGQRTTARRMYDLQLEIVRILHRRGVPILAGSDAGDTYVYDGSSMHDEMVELARAGLTPMEVLLAATRNVAQVSGVLHQLGTVSVGKAADLVILDADPLVDIANVRRIHAVMRAGRLMRRAELDQLLR